MKVRKFCQETKKPGPCKGQRRGVAKAEAALNRLTHPGYLGPKVPGHIGGNPLAARKAVRQPAAQRSGGVIGAGKKLLRKALGAIGVSSHPTAKKIREIRFQRNKNVPAENKYLSSSAAGAYIPEVQQSKGVQEAMLRRRKAKGYTERFAEDFYIEIDMDVLPGPVV